MSSSSHILSSPIEYLKGVGPQKADLLKKELNIFTFGDLLEHFPFRHVDRTKINFIKDISPQMDFVQVAVVVVSLEAMGQRQGKRLVAEVKDKTGRMELTWFQSLSWVEKSIEVGQSYLVYGRVSFYNGQPQIVHPETELLSINQQPGKNFLEPVYSTTEKLKARGLGGRQIGKLTQLLMGMVHEKDVPENLPESILNKLKLINRFKAYRQIHFPQNADEFTEAVNRIKFEELFLAQLRMNLLRSQRHRFSKGVVFEKVGDLFNTFYEKHLPFQLTGAQKRVVKEIRNDTAKGKQMNRLLQGDVGSGKTIVAVLCMLLAADNGCQSCLMAPTEILAQQHFKTISELLGKMDVPVQILTGSTKAAARRKILQQLIDGQLQILIGTHAVIEEVVKFKNLGIVIIDEQHRFGVAQRAKLWQKATVPPHILVMTATPIPRTLAMTAYGDLDYSVIDELPPGRQPITTVHRYESQRSKVMSFIRTEIDKGRQIYIIFPLIEESAKLDYENLMQGYENVKAYFPEPKYWISMVHGKQPAAQKEQNMKRFVDKDTQIMVSTTVIEVGVNVPNATVMVIESTEKFGLSQLHQLRGRVGRGADKSYCILLSGSKLGNDARERISIMTSTNNGFEIAEKDLELRGPGEIEGTKQSGVLNFKLASIVQDRQVLDVARNIAANLLDKDPDLSSAENLLLNNFLKQKKGSVLWSKIS
ncbi:MAG: ATP-dependent DNA helicase RecG [Chitinophagaceae bacterium]|nr:ATP-dependent DNA helicase RecG [Chitinophagaceae bacterium]MBP6476799.1 ATP-dependent DNA helicase RecG [Chitinophagaceae bacterium]MBP7107588.1 ATP-dependent DNA helicase RecG [Chitinophagaceae bacterium]MBP7315068.1 ATP-dependent DNA helicase RecG [Chitinophagaceae bacterium]HRA10960.1 ATP-dependent DNA helicase RecG [Chitinophagaceae bacterium]